MKAKHLFGLAWLLFFGLARTESLAAAKPLVRFVGGDVAICVEAPRLGERLSALADSQLFKRLKNSSFYRQWLGSKDYRKLENARQFIEKLTGKPFHQFASELFGESVVLALYPTGGDELAGVLLTRTSSAEDLQAALDMWNRAEPRHRLQRLEHAGQTYFHRTKLATGTKPAETQYYVAMGRLLAFSDTQSLIRQVIELNRDSAGGSGGECLSDSPLYRTARRSLSRNTVASIYLNPRQLDGVLKPKPGNPDPPPQALMEIWQRIESLIFGLRLEEGLVIEAVAHYTRGNASGRWSRFVEKASGPPDFLQNIPRDALAAVAGRHDLAGLAEWALEQMPEKDRQQLNGLRNVARGLLMGLDLLDDVLAGLRPNWSLYVVPATHSQGDAPPVGGLLAFELPPDAEPKPGRGKANLHDALRNGLDTAMYLAVAAHNGKSPDAPATVRNTEVSVPQQAKKVSVRWIDGLAGYRPAYAITPKHLLFASSEKLIEEFLSAESKERLVSDDGFQRWRESFFPRANQVVFVNVAKVREFAASQREYFVRQAARSKSVTDDEAERRLNRLDDVLQLADGAFLAARIADDHLRVVLGVALNKPARPEDAE